MFWKIVLHIIYVLVMLCILGMIGRFTTSDLDGSVGLIIDSLIYLYGLWVIIVIGNKIGFRCVRVSP